MLKLVFLVCLIGCEPVHFSIECSNNPKAICQQTTGTVERNPLLTTCPECLENDWHEYFHFVRSVGRNPRQGEVSYWPMSIRLCPARPLE